MARALHRVSWCAVTIILLFSSVRATDKGNDSPLPTFRSTVSEVRVTFFANDKQNRNVSELQPADFAVVDDEIIVRDFRSFSRSDQTGLDLVLLIDCSESVAPRFRKEMAEIVQLMAQARWLAEDQISIMSFAGMKVSLLCAGNCRDNISESRLFPVVAQGATPLSDAMLEAAEFLHQRRNNVLRPVVVLFSDGLDTISRSSPHQALRAALAAETQIYSVDLNPTPGSSGTALLRGLANLTGGRYFQMDEGASKVVGAVLDDLHGGYTVTYQLPSGAPGFHSVQILPTRNLNLRFRCRRGYYYPANNL